MMQAIYVYGVINPDEKKEFKSLEKVNSGGIYAIPYQDVACVVSNYPEGSFDFRTKEVGKKLIRHQTVIEKVMEDYTIIPIKFGTLLKNREEVKKVLSEGYFEFKERLKKIDNEIEFDVLAVWNDLNSVIKEIGEKNEEIRKFKQEMRSRPPHNTFQERIKLGSMIKIALDKKRYELGVEMLDFLNDKVKVKELKKHELIDDKMILYCAFLLDKEEECKLDQALKELNKKYNDTIDFRCVGPLPLYSFFTYEVKKVNFEVIDKARNLLGLPEIVTAPDIKASFRRLAREKHPDRFPNDIRAQKEFEEIQGAYRLLLDYCRAEKKSLKREEVKNTFIISIFDLGFLNE